MNAPPVWYHPPVTAPPQSSARAAAVARPLLVAEASRDRDLFELRLERYWADLRDGLLEVYGERADVDDVLDAVVAELARGYAARPEPLRRLDLARDLDPDWFLRPEMVGYVCYADRFAGTLPRRRRSGSPTWRSSASPTST